MTNEQMSKVIKKLRGNLSLREFAKKCGISHTTIDNLEKGIDHRTGKPPQVKMSTLEKIFEACNLPSSLTFVTLNTDWDTDDLLDRFLSGEAWGASEDGEIKRWGPQYHGDLDRDLDHRDEDGLYQKILSLDEEDQGRVDGFVSGLLASEKYQKLEQTHTLKIAARGGGKKELTLTDDQLRQLMDMVGITDDNS